MPTNKERSEIAARFRGIENNITEDMWFHWEDVVCESWHIILKTIGVDNGNPYDDYRKLCERLADLIEPEEQTCRIEYTDSDEFTIYDHLTCGHVNLRHCHETTSYCSTCGAKVVEYAY